MKNILKIIAMMTLSVAVTSSVFSADEKIPDLEAQNQEPIGIEMSESEISRMNEIDAKGRSATNLELDEYDKLQNKLIKIAEAKTVEARAKTAEEKAETESYNKVGETLNAIGQVLKQQGRSDKR